jgi:hypothetical protein
MAAVSKVEVSIAGREAPMVQATEIIADLADWVEFCTQKHTVTGLRITLNLAPGSDAKEVVRLAEAAARAMNPSPLAKSARSPNPA